MVSRVPSTLIVTQIFSVEQNRAPTLAEQLAGKRSLTQVGRALDEAGIGWIGARSPEAKGRVERLWNTLQDRLVTELRLEAITTIEAANAFLPGFLLRHNERFAVPAADAAPAWRPWPDGLSAEAVFCFHYPRRVGEGQHGQLAGRRSRPAAPQRRAQLGRADGHPPGAPRRQPVGQPRGPVPHGPAGACRRRTASGPQARAAVGWRSAGRTRRAPCR
jgi:hypothetical protein